MRSDSAKKLEVRSQDQSKFIGVKQRILSDRERTPAFREGVHGQQSENYGSTGFKIQQFEIAAGGKDGEQLPGAPSSKRHSHHKRQEKLDKYQRDLQPSRRPLIHRYKKSLLLSDFEVFVSLLKFMIAVGVFYRPRLYYDAGLYDAIVAELVALFAVLVANSFLIKCLEYMPKQLTAPESNLTYGKVVYYILDCREERISNQLRRELNISQTSQTALTPDFQLKRKPSRFFQDTLDIQVVISSLCLCISYQRYILDQLLQIMAQNQITLNYEPLGIQNKEIICLVSGSVVFLLLFVNLKQMSFVARLVTLVSIFVIGWVAFEASIKIYLMNLIKTNAPPISTLQNQTLVSVPDTHNFSGLGTTTSGQQSLKTTGIGMTNSTMLNLTERVVNASLEQNPISPIKHQTETDHDMSPLVPLWRPFIPNFMDFFAQATGIYEGIPLLPALYSNARHRRNFAKVQRLVVASLCCFLVVFSPLCMAAYGNSLRDIVLLNLDYGRFETIIQVAYSLCLIYNLTINIFPVIAILNNLRERYKSRKDTSLDRNRPVTPLRDGRAPKGPSFVSRICEFSVNILTGNQVLLRFLLCYFVMLVSMRVKSIELPFMINSAICSNYFQIILPCFMMMQMTEEIQLLRKTRLATQQEESILQRRRGSRHANRSRDGGSQFELTSREQTSESRDRFLANFQASKSFNTKTAHIVLWYGVICLLWGSISIWNIIKCQYLIDDERFY